jgi:hypothetical protein
MRRVLAVSAAALVLLAAGDAVATSIATARPHDPVEACRVIKQLVANLNSGDLDEGIPFPGPLFSTDALGEIAPKEEAAFLHSMRNSAGKADRVPIRLYRVLIIRRDKHRPVYLVVLERQAWHETSYDTDEMMNVIPVHNPQYRVDESFWLATFQWNVIENFREVPELYDFLGKGRRLRNCSSD